MMRINRLSYSIFILISIFVVSAYAQTPSNETTVSPVSQTITADENFQLNITSDRITETNFARSTDVKLNNDTRGGLRLEVGVGVQAERIDVLMRGVFGNVRFRASLESIKNRVDQLRQNSIAPR